MPTRVISRLIPGGPGGCLLLHGFSGSPLEMMPMAESLAAEGWTVAVAELAGHASPSELARATAEDWLQSGEAAHRELRARCSQTAIVGLSMGGAVGLLLAASLGPSAVVTISTPVRMKRLLARASQAASHLIPYVPVLMKLGPREREMRRYRSPARRIPLRATAEVERLLASMRDALPQVGVPVLVVQGRRDWVIPKESAQEIASGTRGTVLWLPRSGHVAPLDRDRVLLYREVAAFLHEHLGPREEAGRGTAD